MPPVSKRNKDILCSGADIRWPGSGEYFVAIHEFMRQGGKAKGLDSAIRINFFLTMGGDRSKNLACFKRDIEARAPKREGMRMELYKVAVQAINELIIMHRAESGFPIPDA